MKNKLLFSLVILTLFLMLAAGMILKKLSDPMPLSEPVTFDVKYGDSIYQVARNLQEQQLFDMPLLVVWYARLMDLAPLIKAGEYHVTPDDNVLTFIDNVVRGKVKKHKVTFIEGWTAEKALGYLQSSEGVVTTLDMESAVLFMQEIKGMEHFESIEGLIFPATYKYVRGTRDSTIIRQALLKMRNELDRLWRGRVEDLPYKTPYQALVMASIIEKETAKSSEREQIAGVFVERLKVGMRLQADPTVIYGMGKNFQGNISGSDLRKKTPYNTYRIKGLPPTPIALPGKASIAAAMNPLLNGMLYFVAKGDGSHEFSKDLSSHNKAVREFQLRK